MDQSLPDQLPIETIANSESVAEKQPVIEASPPMVIPTVPPAKPTITPVPTPPKVVDMRLPGDQTQSVTPSSQKLTSIADEEEKEFIENVEEIHTIKP